LTRRFFAVTGLAMGLAAALLVARAYTGQMSGQNHLDRAVTLEKSGKLAEALAQLKDAVSTDPDLVAARFELGRFYLRIGRATQAQVELEAARAKGFDENQIALPLMRAYIANGDFQGVLKKFDAAKFSGNMRAAVLTMQARAQIALHDPVAARTLTTQALAQAPELPPVLVVAAMVERADQNFSVSEKYVDQGLAAEPGNLELLILKAEARTQEKDYDAAAGILDRLVRDFPRNTRVRTLRALLNLLRNNPGDLTEDAAPISRINSKDPIGAFLRAHILYRRELYSDAVAVLLTVPKLIDQYPPALYLLAAASYGDNQLKTAVHHAETYVMRVPDNVSGVELLATAAMRNDEAGRAVQALEPAVKMHPNDTQLRVQLAAAYQAAGRSGDAIKLLDDRASADKGAEVALALQKLRSETKIVGKTPPVVDLVQGNPDSLEFHRFIGGELWGR
jgi:predicted Zn-dependent protease